MKFIKPDVKLVEQEFPPKMQNSELFKSMYLNSMYIHIERCGRVCYKSEDKIGDKGSEIFVNRMINSKHYSVLEHGTIYLKYPLEKIESVKGIWGQNPYTQIKFNGSDMYVTTNYRVIVENNLYDELIYLSVPTEHHYKRITVEVTTDIGVSREGARHRKNSISEESTRYCNYSNNKFGNEITYAIPSDITEDSIDQRLENLECDTISHNDILSFNTRYWDKLDWWLWGLKCCEIAYMKQIELGAIPQEARRVLPLNTKTTVVHTAFESDWNHFILLRSNGITGAPHPDMKIIADVIKDKLNNQN